MRRLRKTQSGLLVHDPPHVNAAQTPRPRFDYRSRRRREFLSFESSSFFFLITSRNYQEPSRFPPWRAYRASWTRPKRPMHSDKNTSDRCPRLCPRMLRELRFRITSERVASIFRPRRNFRSHNLRPASDAWSLPRSSPLCVYR